MIRLQDLTQSFAGRELYRDVSVFIGERSRVGLVGPNGSGKSTIFRLILKDLEPDTGSVEVQRDVRIGWLPQTGIVLKDRTVLAETMTAFPEVARMEDDLTKLESHLHSGKESGSRLAQLLDRYAHLRERRDHAGYDHESQAKKMLAELGFSSADYDRPTSYSSGGFQVRIALAKLLLQEPDVLLLDEPTNYLDIKAIAWLQEYLKGFRGAYVLITHDRYLLDACVDRIWAIERPNVVTYKGNYSAYAAAKTARDSQLEKAAEQQQKEIEKAERFIEQFRARKDTARRVKSRQKMLERMERVVLPEKRTRLRFRFPEAARIYGQAVSLKAVSQCFSTHPVVSDVNLAVAGGERLALFGANGEGKTTLLRIISGDLAPTQGRVWHSEKLKIAFYRQGAEELLDPTLSVIDEVQREAEGYTLLELRTILGAFLFPGDDIYKTVAVLSGGEKTRLALVKVLLRPSNLLLLDEPTNHLDIESREVLEEAISDYQNTVIFAAHDRYMIDRLATRTVAVRNGRAEVFPGNYSYATSNRTAPAERPRAPELAQTTKPARPQQPPVTGGLQRGVASRMKTAPAVTVPPDPAQLRRIRIRSLEQRLGQLEEDYQDAKSNLDFVRAREIWAQHQSIAEEIANLKNEV